MSIGVSLLVLLAAVLHASWNALLRAGTDRLWSMTVMGAAIATSCAALAPVVPLPARASWGLAVLSMVLHVGYNLFLVRTYRSGDLGQGYPIARGSSPLLVSLGAALFAGEWPDPVSMTGVVMVSGGIIALAFQGRGLALDSLPYALGTGCFIGAYSVTDGIGARLSGTPAGYTVWSCLLWGAAMVPIYLAMRGWPSLLRSPRETAVAAGGGLVSLTAYGIIIAAMSLGPMGPVSALRETSVIFAALIGRFFLNETLPASRAIACLVVAIGAICIGHQRAPQAPSPEPSASHVAAACHRSARGGTCGGPTLPPETPALTDDARYVQLSLRTISIVTLDAPSDLMVTLPRVDVMENGRTPDGSRHTAGLAIGA